MTERGEASPRVSLDTVYVVWELDKNELGRRVVGGEEMEIQEDCSQTAAQKKIANRSKSVDSEL